MADEAGFRREAERWHYHPGRVGQNNTVYRQPLCPVAVLQWYRANWAVIFATTLTLANGICVAALFACGWLWAVANSLGAATSFAANAVWRVAWFALLLGNRWFGTCHDGTADATTPTRAFEKRLYIK